MFKSTDNQTLLTGVNSVGLVSLLAYTLRTFNEVNANLEDLRSDLDVVKKAFSENNKRSNVAFSHLNSKLEENSRMLSIQMNSVRQSTRDIKPSSRVNKIYTNEQLQEEEEEIEEISTFKTQNQTDEISGALSDLLAG